MAWEPLGCGLDAPRVPRYNCCMILSKILLYALAAIFGVALNSYLFLNSAIQKIQGSGKVNITNGSDDPVASAAQAENPNKLLFISCGGFEE